MWKRQIIQVVRLLVVLSITCLGGMFVQADTLYVTSGSYGMSVIDTSTNSVMATMFTRIGSSSTNFNSIVASPDGTYVHMIQNSFMYLVDTSNYSIVGGANLLGPNHGVGHIVANPTGTRIYVANGLDEHVRVIDISTYSIIADIPVGITPTGIDIDQKRNRVYVTNKNSNTTSIIDTDQNKVVNTIAVGTHPVDVVVNPSGSLVYIAADGSYKDGGIVDVIDANTEKTIATIPLESYNISRIAIHPEGKYVYVASGSNNSITVIDTKTNSINNIISMRESPCDLALSSEGRLYVVNCGDDNRTISVIDTNTNKLESDIVIGKTSGMYLSRSAIVKSTKSTSALVPRSLPSLGNGKVINGTISYTNTNFAGGATRFNANEDEDFNKWFKRGYPFTIDKLGYQAYLSTKQPTLLYGGKYNVSITWRIKVDPDDVGKQADLLCVVGFEYQSPFDGGIDTTYSTVFINFSYHSLSYSPLDLYNQPNVWTDQLVATPYRENYILQNEMIIDGVPINMRFGSGVYYYFTGYRLIKDGKIVYSYIPIVIKMD